MADGLMPEQGTVVHFPLSSSFAGSGVYLLHCAGEIVYVGQARELRARIGQHFGEGQKVFDAVSCIPCEVEEMAALEAALIAYLTPKHNQCRIAKFHRSLPARPDYRMKPAHAAALLGLSVRALADLGQDGPRRITGRTPRKRVKYTAYMLSDLMAYRVHICKQLRA